MSWGVWKAMAVTRLGHRESDGSPACCGVGVV